jgi:soluble cytochrome b562
MSFGQSATTLCAAFQEETEHYERALHIARALPAAVQRGQDTESQLQEIMVHLTDIARIEQTIAEAKHHWLQSKEEVSPELEAYRTRLITLIQQLQEQFDRAEQEATLQQSRLLPELESLLRGQQMQRAYGAVVRPER